MINNRQGGRRRGRGGQRTQGQGQSGQPGNRQDNRQRGNAAQLLEKYKSMARDSQLAGDRVQTEYYLQFADHYFRVLGESRSRFEDQRPQRSGDDLDEDEGEDELVDADGNEAQDERSSRQPRRDREPQRRDRDDQPRQRADRPDEQRDDDREERPERRDPAPRSNRDDQPRQRAERIDELVSEDRDERPVRRKRSNGANETLSLSALPPAIGRTEASTADEAAETSTEDSPKPRRRARAVKAADGDDEAAPLA